jgi:NAD(P)-dependent dehydrogenase (short-subunit alcohol dehydrogenase family)
MADRVKGKIAIVTGGGSIGPGIGNGKAAAIVYAREGASVMVVDNNRKAAEDTRDIIIGEGGTSIAFEADVSQASDCTNMVEKCIDHFGKIDILHNNVGIEIPAGIDSASEVDWDRTIEVNLKSMFLTCKYTLPYMENNASGSIVNISSINAIRTLPAFSVAYSSSKAGIIALTREIALQYAPKHIRVNAVLPGLMNTPFVVASLTSAYGGEVTEMIKKRDAMCPMGKQGDSWDVAYAALFLASDEAKYITGISLIVDGGLTLKS